MKLPDNTREAGAGTLDSRSWQRILIHAPNWVGDAVMCLPAMRSVRERFPESTIAVLARPWVAELYRRERFVNHVIEAPSGRGLGEWGLKWRLARRLRGERFDAALLLPNSFESAAIVRLAGIGQRIGYNRDGRGLLLTYAIAPPRKGDIPRHESYYYLEMLRRAGLLDKLPASVTIRLDRIDEARDAGLRRFAALGLPNRVVGVAPGAAYGGAKRWLPERFAEATKRLCAQLGGSAVLFGSGGERALCEQVAGALRGVEVRNVAGQTSLGEFVELAAACDVFLTNDSGAMHIAASVAVPTVAVFGATDAEATGPTGPLARVVRESVECSPCLLRECPIDHRCMTRVDAARVANVALDLLK